ncbi:MAG: DUF308 domain-containing protein [Actinomycetota bacterium]
MEQAFIARHWGLMLLNGLLTLAFGIAILVWPQATTLVLLIFFGVLAILFGIVHIVGAIIAARKQESWVLELFLGLAEIVIGIIVLARPGVGVAAVLVLIIVWLMAMGMTELFAAIEVKASAGWKVFLGILGLISLVIGFVFMFNPLFGIKTVILILGIYAVCMGVLRVIFAFVIRSWLKGEPAAPAYA